MSNDSANLSIDFMIGFTIFMIGFIWVVSMIPGLLINLQGYTIDYDAVAYRTGVILVEDPGEPDAWHVGDYYTEWNKADVARLGLAVSRDDPNILALDKVNRFFNEPTFVYPADYHAKAIFGDYPYRFNISISEIDGTPLDMGSIGDPVPDGYGYIRRLVKIKSTTSAELKGTNADPFQNGHPVDAAGSTIDGNETTHIFAILLNNTELTGTESAIRDPAYQIIPGKESFAINLTDIRSNLWNYWTSTHGHFPHDPRADCFTIKLKAGDIWITDGVTSRNLNKPMIIIDGDSVTPLSNTQTVVGQYILINYDASVDNPQVQGINWDADRVYIYLKFTLENSGDDITNGEAEAVDCGEYPGSRFLHTTFIGDDPVNPFIYNYTESRVTQPPLSDAVVEVAVW
jgi:hypothetical protein